MLHFRSKREIEDLPVRIFAAGSGFGLGTANKLGNMRGIIGALDIGSCFNIAKVRLDLWIHDWTNTGMSGPVPTGVTENARFRVQRTFERGEFVLLSPVFDFFVFAHSLGDDPVKTYADEAARLADATLTNNQIGLAFRQTAPTVTNWLLLRPKTENSEGEWQQLLDPIPRVKAALVSAMGGGIGNPSVAPLGYPIFPASLIVGTSYSDGKFQPTADPNFLTYNGRMVPTFEYALGVEYFDYDPAVTPAEPANLFEQIGRTVKVHTAFPETEPRSLIKADNGIVGYFYNGNLIGLNNQYPFWPNYDQTPQREFFTAGFPFPVSLGVHNDSWFVRDHSFPGNVFQFPQLDRDNDNNLYPPTTGEVNAGFESILQSSLEPGLLIGRHYDFKIAIKLDMGVLAQENPDEYPPADPSRYIRHLDAMK